MRLLVTRAAGEAETLAQILKAAGHRPVIYPLTEIELLAPGVERWEVFDAIVVTSRNALRALARDADPAMLARPLIAVGPGTAALAREHGFRRVLEGPGTARQLPAFIAANGFGQGSRIFYASGEDVAFDLAGALGAVGCAVETCVVYRAKPVKTLAADVAHDLATGELDGVILMSPRTATLYRRLLEAHGITPHASIMHLCLSERVADALKDLGVPTATPPQPDLGAMLAQIGRIASEKAQQNAQS